MRDLQTSTDLSHFSETQAQFRRAAAGSSSGGHIKALGSLQAHKGQEAYAQFGAAGEYYCEVSQSHADRIKNASGYFETRRKKRRPQTNPPPKLLNARLQKRSRRPNRPRLRRLLRRRNRDFQRRPSAHARPRTRRLHRLLGPQFLPVPRALVPRDAAAPAPRPVPHAP